jgi:hypothetical protein
MTNRIQLVRVTTVRLNPAEARLRIAVSPKYLTEKTEIRGRLTGPHCLYATTVEVAYPLRPEGRTEDAQGSPSIVANVIIPEPSWWEPETPFLYQGPVELWEGGQLCDQLDLSHGLLSLRLGPRGLRLNGRPFIIRGVAGSRLSEADARRWRHHGFNTLLVPLTVDTVRWWDEVDRWGFLMIGSIADPMHAGPAALEVVEHPSFLGWLLSEQALHQKLPRDWPRALIGENRESRLGCELDSPPAAGLPDEVRFVVCRKDRRSALAAMPLPKIIRVDQRPAEVEEKELLDSPDVLGWISDPPAQP